MQPYNPSLPNSETKLKAVPLKICKHCYKQLNSATVHGWENPIIYFAKCYCIFSFGYRLTLYYNWCIDLFVTKTCWLFLNYFYWNVNHVLHAEIELTRVLDPPEFSTIFESLWLFGLVFNLTNFAWRRIDLWCIEINFMFTRKTYPWKLLSRGNAILLVIAT